MPAFKRKIFYLSGFDPRGARFYHQLFAEQAEAFGRTYDELNVHDDQLDIAEATFSISIALYGITALTHTRWLLLLAGLFSIVGATFGLAGFLGWSLHPDWLARLLT